MKKNDKKEEKKEVKVKEKIKEIKKEDEEQDEGELFEEEELIRKILNKVPQITEIEQETDRTNGMLEEDGDLVIPNFSLEDVVADEPSTYPERVEQTGDFYKNDKTDFYSNGKGAYAGTTDTRSKVYSGGEQENEGRGFYTKPGDSEERVGEIRGEKRSGLEIGGSSVRRDRRVDDEKYTNNSY